jgi:hypothetical protein
LFGTFTQFLIEPEVLCTFHLSYPGEKMPLFLKLIDYLLAAVFISAAIIIYFASSNQQHVIVGAGALAVAIFSFLLNRSSVNNARKDAQQAELQQKAEIYTSLLTHSNSLENNRPLAKLILVIMGGYLYFSQKLELHGYV